MKYFILLTILLSACNSPSDGNKEDIFSEDQSKNEINKFLNSWHRSAAVADEDIFFGSIAEGGIYLGTDKTERWDKQSFMDWGLKYFERDTAWAFEPYDRTIYFAENGNTAWFEESLRTWMGICRGSGVVLKKDSLWKIAHYNLAVTIDNEKIDGFIELTAP